MSVKDVRVVMVYASALVIDFDSMFLALNAAIFVAEFTEVRARYNVIRSSINLRLQRPSSPR